MTFRTGQKVACVSTSNGIDLPGEPAVGDTATISNVYVAADGTLMLELVEWPSPETERVYAGWDAKYFRPIVERKTDISIFKKMLKPQGVDA